MSRVTAPELARRFLLAVRTEDAAMADAAAEALARLTEDDLARDLPDDPTRIATWVNLYNAATQRLVDADPAAYARRTRFFRQSALVVAGRMLTLDTLEHGLLRRSRPKIGLGYLPNPLAGRFERRFRVARPDPRVHFALNCAAASCPPIAAYDADRLDAQLDLATRAYLGATVRRDGETLIVSRIFRWFPGDFGGPGGIRRFLAAHGHPTDGLRLRYAAWDWTPAPDAWRIESSAPTVPTATPPEAPL
jgi:hypothetical protein